MYTRPVTPTGISSWRDHTRRGPPSQEAGVDYYCPIGTPILAAGDGRVVAVAGDVNAATGRYLTIDLDDGRRVRYLHLSRWAKSAGDPVRQGAVVAYSGASGYGSEFFGGSGMDDFPWGDTGGPHVHVTLWPSHAYSFGVNAGTLDFDAHAGGSTAGLDATELPTNESEEDSMRFIDGPNLIVWPNGVLNSYELNVYTVIKQYVLYPTHPVWGGGRETFERELWAAFDWARASYVTVLGCPPWRPR